MSSREELKLTFESKYKKYDFKDIKVLYHCNYYDGMLSGVCSIEGKRYYLECIIENEDIYREDDEDFEPEWYRKFIIYDLDEKTWQDEDIRDALFVKYVGPHCHYDLNGESTYPNRPIGSCREQSSWQQYYDVYPCDRGDRISNNIGSFPAIGWFQR